MHPYLHTERHSNWPIPVLKPFFSVILWSSFSLYELNTLTTRLPKVSGTPLQLVDKVLNIYYCRTKRISSTTKFTFNFSKILFVSITNRRSNITRTTNQCNKCKDSPSFHVSLQLCCLCRKMSIKEQHSVSVVYEPFPPL